MLTDLCKEPGKNTPSAKGTSFATPAKSAKNGKERDFASFATVLCHPANPGKERSPLSIKRGRPLPIATEVCHDR